MVSPMDPTGRDPRIAAAPSTLARALIPDQAARSREKERYSMYFIARRRLASMATASALVAMIAVASSPASTLAASCQATGFIRDGIDLTAAQIGGTVSGQLDATGCDIGVYNPTRVTGAEIFGARYYGVVANGGT